jgi:hypothetical protein
MMKDSFRLRLLFCYFLLLAPAVLIPATSCYASDSGFHWSCNYSQGNDRIEVTIGTDYGPLDGASVKVKWQDVETGAWTELVNSTLSVNSPISKFLIPPGARNGKQYLVTASFTKKGVDVDSESQQIVWGDPNSGTNIVSDSQVPALLLDAGGPFERLIANLIDGIRIVCDWAVTNFIGAKPYSVLIFNAGLSDRDKECAPFTEIEIGMIWAWYKAMAAGSFILVLIAVVATAFKFTASPFNIALREDAVASMWRWLWAVIIIACAPVFYYAMIRINNGLVDLFLDIASKVSPGKGIDSTLLDPSALANLQTGHILATAIVKLALSFVRLYLTIIYTIRRFVLLIILIFTPVMAWLWSLNKNINAAQIWLGEITSNVFMQAAHAFVFLVLLSFISLNYGYQPAQDLIGDPGALGTSLMELLVVYGVPLGGAVLFASVCWVAVQIITFRFNPGKREGVFNNLLYVGAGGIIFGAVVFFASLVSGIARSYFPHVF